MTTQAEKDEIKAMFVEDAKPGAVRQFDTGATRSPVGDKLCYDRFFSPRVLKRKAEYMHLHRKQSDGTIREPDNWQKGIPQKSYMESMARHYMDVWLYQAGYPELMEEDIETALCALSFNVDGMLFEILKLSDSH